MTGYGTRHLDVVATLILLLFSSVEGQINDPRPGAIVHTEEQKQLNRNPLSGSGVQQQQPRPRIIGGTAAPEGRYPYFVSLLNQYGQRSCGGMLVSPDVVMTAAHCSNIKFAQVGRWSLTDDLDGYEEFQVDQLFPHPLYNSGTSFSHDAMLLKLNRQSTKTYIRINDNPDLPSEASASVRNSLTTMGLGYTKYASSKSEPDYLQEASLSYVPNHVCERSKDPDVADTYQGLISEDMLCASDNGEDACQGDSGGPLIVRRETPEDDVLVGIVSWGFGCAHPYYPGVFSRVSYFSDWTKMMICDISSSPPADFDCGNVAALPSEDNSVPLTVIIQLDDHPTETSWSIVRKETDTVLVNVASGTYTAAQSTQQETVFLPQGSNNYFRIFDSHGDGLCCDVPGNYRVVLGRNGDGQVLVSGGGDFGSEKLHEFQVPGDFKDKSEEVDVAEGQIPLTVVIQLDDFPQEVGWRIDRLDVENEEIIRIPAGLYLTQEMIVVRTVVLEENELYNFEIYDMTNDGIENGKVQLFLGTTDIFDYSRMIFESDGKFQSAMYHTFLANFDNSLSDSSFLPNQSFLTLELRMDLYPGEISIQIRMSNEEESVGRSNEHPHSLIFFRPPGYYADSVGDTVREQIPIPDVTPTASRQFTFIITDKNEDGLCCAWKESSETGYTLFEGEPDSGSVIVSSKFESSGREIKIFSIIGSDAFPEDFSSGDLSSQSYEVKVSIALDVYPDETGFYIEDFLNRRVVDVPPGTYGSGQSSIEEIVTLQAGLYSFTIMDSFGDGINRADGFYRLDFVGNADRLPLLTGSGAFASQESRVFVVEGERATYPMFIRTPAGSNRLHFDVYRLDLVESDALVASRGIEASDDAGEHIIFVTEGSLYRVVFENDGQDLEGSIEINLGTNNPSVFKGLEYVVDPEADVNSHKWQVKFLAGQSLESDEAVDVQVLTLRMQFDRFPSEVEWMLLSSDERSNTWGRGFESRHLLAFGPETLYDQSLENAVLTEKITIPKYDNDKTYTLVVTDAGNDGLCCSFGQGGPIELFLGESREGQLLFAESFQNGRLARNFVLTGTTSGCVKYVWSWRKAVILTSIIIAVVI